MIRNMRLPSRRRRPRERDPVGDSQIAAARLVVCAVPHEDEGLPRGARELGRVEEARGPDHCGAEDVRVVEREGQAVGRAVGEAEDCGPGHVDRREHALGLLCRQMGEALRCGVRWGTRPQVGSPNNLTGLGLIDLELERTSEAPPPKTTESGFVVSKRAHGTDARPDPSSARATPATSLGDPAFGRRARFSDPEA